MRAQIAAMRALAYWTGAFVDRAARSPTRRAAAHAAERVDAADPDRQGVVHRPRQRDRLDRRAGPWRHGLHRGDRRGPALPRRRASSPIYEGTNGIQALDLVGRKLELDGGEAIRRLLAELRADLETADPELRPGLAAAQDALEAATRHLQAAGPDARAAAATAYLRLFGHTLGGFLLARGARAATGEEGRDWPGLARFYVRHLLPPAVGLLPVDHRRRGGPGPGAAGGVKGPALAAQRVRTKASVTPLVSPWTRLLASDVKATSSPSAVIAGAPRVLALPCAPSAPTLTRVVVWCWRSRTKMSCVPFVSPATRFGRGRREGDELTVGRDTSPTSR